MLEAGGRFVEGLPDGDAVALWILNAPSTMLRFNEPRDAVVRRLREAVGTYRPGPGLAAQPPAQANVRTELRLDPGSERRVYVRTDYGPIPAIPVLAPLRIVGVVRRG